MSSPSAPQPESSSRRESTTGRHPVREWFEANEEEDDDDEILELESPEPRAYSDPEGNGDEDEDEAEDQGFFGKAYTFSVAY